MALSSRARKVFGALHLVSGAIVAGGVFAGLPVRYWPIDAPAATLSSALFLSATGLLLRTSWRERVARVVSWGTLVVGLALTALLTLTASHLAGLYGPIGRGGALIFLLVAVLVVPYLVAIPALSVHWLSRRKH